MPKTDTPSAESIAFHVPAPLLQEAQEMAEIEGWKLAEFHRLCWEQGLAAQAEKSNKRLVNKGLRAKHKEKPSEAPEGMINIEQLRKTFNAAKEKGSTEVLIKLNGDEYTVLLHDQ